MQAWCFRVVLLGGMKVIRQSVKERDMTREVKGDERVKEVHEATQCPAPFSCGTERSGRRREAGGRLEIEEQVVC